MSKIERVPSGIPGLDEMLNGGIPKERVILIIGGPGTGKTIISSQFLVNGICDHNESCLFVSLDENKHHLMRELSSFGWNISEYEKRRKWNFIDLSPLQIFNKTQLVKQQRGENEFSFDTALESIRICVKSVDVKRIVLDTMTSLVFQYPDIIKRRSLILKLIDTLSSTGATTLMTTELRTSGLDRSLQLEEYLAHGVILLQTLQVGKSITRVLQIEKMRETQIDTQLRPYRITEKGIEVYPRESIF